MYTEKQISNALEAFDRVGSITAVINQLGYPSRTMLYNWLKAQGTGRRKPHSGSYPYRLHLGNLS